MPLSRGGCASHFLTIWGRGVAHRQISKVNKDAAACKSFDMYNSRGSVIRPCLFKRAIIQLVEVLPNFTRLPLPHMDRHGACAFLFITKPTGRLGAECRRAIALNNLVEKSRLRACRQHLFHSL